MQSIKGVLLLFTLCLCASGIWGKSSSKVFDSVWEDLGDKGDSILNGLRDATQDGATKQSDLLNKLDEIKGTFLDDFTQLGHDMSIAISKAVVTGLADLAQALSDNLSALQAKVAAERSIIKKKALRSGLTTLVKLVKVTNELQSLFADINERLAEKVNNQINEIFEDLLRWTEEQLQSVDKETNGVGLPEARNLVEALIKQFTENFVHALDEIEFKKTLIEQELNDKIDEYTAYVNDLIDTMNSSKILDITQWTDRIEELVENLRDAQDELQSLVQKGKDLLNEGIFAGGSIDAIMRQLVSDALELEKSLKAIIDKAPPSKSDGGC